jgi:hypothetical protein
VANRKTRKRRNQAKTVATGCDQLPWDLDGKEGVDGSSPSEGFEKALQIGLSVVCPDAAPASRGYETGTFSDWRALAGTRGLVRPPSWFAASAPSDRKCLQTRLCVAGAGAKATTSFASEEVTQGVLCSAGGALPLQPCAASAPLREVRL